jgi:integrase
MLMLDKDTLDELSRVETELAVLLPRLSKAKVRELRGIILRHFLKTYNVRAKPPAYGTLNKGFSEDELARFLNCIDSKKWYLLFSFQARLGLRIGEVVKVNLKDFNLSTRELKIFTEKARVLNTLIVPQVLFDETLEYIKENKAQIDKAQGYIFYPNREAAHNTTRKVPYLELNYVRKVFRGYIRAAGLDEVYGTSEGSVQRHLHRLTTHSLRHYSITKFYKATKDPIMTSRFARHLKAETTLTYIHSDKSELYAQIEQMASPLKVQANS